MCIFTQKNTKVPPVFFHKTLHFKILLCFFTKHLNPSNYKPCLYNLFVYLYTKNIKVPPVFFSQNTTFHKNYKPCLLFVYLYTKNTKDLCFSQKKSCPVYTTYLCIFTQKNIKVPPVFFHKTHFKNPHCSQNYISKHLNPSNYKPCLYNLFVYLYTKNTKDRPVFFHKNTTFQKSSCVLTKHLNPSNYKPCLYNLFVYLYTKNIKVPPVFFSQNTTFQNPHVFFHKTLKSE